MPPSKILGVVNVWDIMGFVASVLTNAPAGATDIELGVRASEKFDTPIVDLLGISVESEMQWVYSADKPLKLAVEAMCKGVHRVIVTEVNSPHRARLLSQTDIARYMSKHIADLGDFVDSSIAQLEIGDRKHIVSITTNDSALAGFQRLMATEVSALAVVDPETGALVDTLSASDARGVEPLNFLSMRLPVREFLAATAPHHLAHDITTPSTSPLRNVIVKLGAGRVHRVWVVDERKRPQSVISLTDLMAALYARM